MQVAFEHSTRNQELDYEMFLKVDTQLEAILVNLPPWLRENGDTTGMPACAEANPFFGVYAEH
jgi:hypothetical protein